MSVKIFTVVKHGPDVLIKSVGFVVGIHESLLYAGRGYWRVRLQKIRITLTRNLFEEQNQPQAPALPAGWVQGKFLGWVPGQGQHFTLGKGKTLVLIH